MKIAHHSSLATAFFFSKNRRSSTGQTKKLPPVHRLLAEARAHRLGRVCFYGEDGGTQGARH